MHRLRVLLACLCLACAWSAHATEPQDRPQESQYFANAGSDGSSHVERLRKRLRDPAERTSLRAEYRALVRSQHPDLAHELSIDAATESKVLDLLTEHQLRDLEASVDRTKARRGIQAQADEQTARMNELRALIGQRGLERYQHYTRTATERQQVQDLDAQLPAQHKLNPDQKRRLLELYVEQNRRALDEQADVQAQVAIAIAGLSGDDPARTSELQTIAMNEATLRQMEKSDALLAQEAARFLSPTQLRALTQMNAKKARAQREWIEQARARAGMPAAMPDAPLMEFDPSVPLREILPGKFEFEFTVQADRHPPKTLTYQGLNGTPYLIDTGGGLLMEATPMLFRDGWLEVYVIYYEQVGGEKRRIDPDARFGAYVGTDDAEPARTESVIVGSQRAYALRASVSVADS